MGTSLNFIEYYLPKKQDLKRHFSKYKWDYNKISSSTGIKCRRVSEVNETSFHLAIKAANKLFKKINKNIVDGIIFVSQSPEKNLPSTSCKLQYFLGLKNNILSFDINQGCSGFVYGLSVANSLILNNQCKNILLLCADTYTKYISESDKTNFPIFSDGASAAIISKTKKNNLLDFKYFTQGQGYNDLCLTGDNKTLFMDGKKVLLFTMSTIPDLVKKFLSKNKIKKENIDHFVFHQASGVVLKNLKRKIDVPDEKFYINLKNIGNTVSSTIPILLSDLVKKKKIKKNQTLLLAGFGVGLSVSLCLMRW